MLESIKRNMAWGAVPVAWLVAATVFLATLMILNPIVYGIDAFFVLPYFASIVQGQDVLNSDSTTTYLIGAVIHYLLAFVATFVIAIVVHRWGFIVGVIGGALLGLAIYGINVYTMTLFYEWMFAIHGLVLVIAHIAFGAVAGGVYELLDNYDEVPFEGTVKA